MADKESTIRIVKKVSGGHGHHGGAWKVAYADFVTAMMAFFLVMWILGLSKPSREAIASYFRGEAGFMNTVKSSPIGEGEVMVQNGLTAPLIPKDGGVNIEEMKEVLKNAQSAILKDLQNLPELKNMKDSVEVEMTKEGLRIQLIETTSSVFFDSGSANVKAQTIKLLQAIAKRLNKLENPIVIEGHTDRHPLGRAGGYSNWELSADRANAARRIMEEGGLRAGQIRAVRGYADRRLKNAQDPFHFSNRRVSILVAFTDLDK